MTMKKTILFSTVALAVLAMSCANDDERFFGNGEGRMVLTTEIKADINVESRASASTEDLNESMILWISNSKGPVRKYKGLSSLPDSEWLLSDHYVAEAWAGDSVSASFTDRWFKGRQEFDIRAGEVTSVNVPCKIANVLASISYADGLTDYFSQYSVTVGHKRGSLTFEGETALSTGYFMMPSTDKNLSWTLKAVTNAGVTVERSGVIENAQPATEYVINVRFDPTGSTVGGTYFDIVVDVTENVVYDDFVLELAPIIKGEGFDISGELLAKPGEVGRRSVLVAASSALTKVEVGMENFSQILGIKSSAGNEFTTINFMTELDPTFVENLLNAGVQGVYSRDDDGNVAMMRINFGDAFTNKLTDGVYRINIRAIDSKDQESSAVFTINVSNDPVQIVEVCDYDVWATSATLTANVLRDDVTSPGLQYRKRGDADWTDATIVRSGDVITAQVSGLTPGTTYEYRARAVVDGAFATDPLAFTTEAAAQLPNSGFEEWNTSTKAYLLYADSGQMFWDSGNHGSATLNKNITVPDNTVKHSGNYSVKMASEKIVVKFAAGNAFVGQYLATEGTDGQLGWGRPFTSRPKALRGYVKYTPKVVTDANGGDLKKGDMDNGIIYIALVDGTTQDADAADKDYVSGLQQKSWPVIVKTKKEKRLLFSKGDANVIAYGEKVFTEATAGDGMIEFEIPIEYFKSNIKAANIVVTMSASRYGDYFTGGDGSTMWVDDLELVY